MMGNHFVGLDHLVFGGLIFLFWLLLLWLLLFWLLFFRVNNLFSFGFGSLLLLLYEVLILMFLLVELVHMELVIPTS